MSGHMFENPGAFAPFFDTAVAVEAAREGGRVIRTTVNACVLDMGLDEPFSDGGTDSRRRAYSVSVQRIDCERSGWRPQIGDVLKFDDGRKLAVKSVSLPVGGAYEMEARE